MRTLSLNTDAGWFAGIEFNAERLRAIKVDFGGHPKSELRIALPSQLNVRAVFAALHTAMTQLTRQASGDLFAIGVGVPGLVDPTTGTAIEYSFMDDWRNVPVVNEVQSRFNVPVTLENNLRAIALAERWFGGGRVLDDYVILGPRRGFGIAVVKEGKLLTGAHRAVGEIGRWRWPLDGNEGELHDWLASPVVWRRLKGVTSRTRVPTDLYAALSEYENATSPSWHAIVDDYASVLGLLHLILDSHTYFLHGPQASLGSRFCCAISERVVQLNPALRSRPLTLVPSTLGDGAGALGAASLAMESWLPLRQG